MMVKNTIQINLNLLRVFGITIIAKFATEPSNLRTKLKMLKDILTDIIGFALIVLKKF